jgi:hypothetical protein
MNELTSMLTTTGLIATLISMLFAVASLVIAHRRKKHHLAMQQHGVHVPVAPVKTEAPMTFKDVPPVVPPAAPVSEPENLAYDTRPTSSPLFKRLGRVGVEQVLPATTPEAATPQEQKSAWE